MHDLFRWELLRQLVGLFMGLDWQAQRPMRQLKQFDWFLVVELQ